MKTNQSRSWKIRREALILPLLIVNACATTSNYELLLQAWVGQSASQLETTWGAPQHTHALADGKRILEYSRESVAPTSGAIYSMPLTLVHAGNGNLSVSNGFSSYPIYPGPAVNPLRRPTASQNLPVNTCTTRFTVSKDNLVTDWSWQGNNCRASAYDIKRNSVTE